MALKNSLGMRAYWSVKCLGRDRECLIPLIRGAPTKPGPAQRWGWDGKDPPTIVPSYHCMECGLHVNIVAGVEVPTRGTP